MAADSLCAEVGHDVMSMFVVRCQHVGDVRLYYSTGTADAPGDTIELRFGPFDTAAEILDTVAGIVRRLLPLPPG